MEQLQQGHSSDRYTFISDCSNSLTYLMPYACLLASCSMGIPYTLSPVL